MTKFFIYEGNAYDILDRLAPHSVDVCYTSPNPAFYLLNKGIEANPFGEDWVIGGEYDTMGYVTHIVRIMEKVKRVLKPTGSLWLNMADYSRTKAGSLIQIPEMVSIALQQNGWLLMSTLIWHRRDSDIPKRRFVRDWEYIYWFVRKPDYYFNEDYDKKDRAIINITYVKPKDDFMSGYPEELVNMAIDSTVPPNGTVLDCFMGSGVTGIAALKKGRYFIGIDINKNVVGRVNEILNHHSQIHP